MLKIATVSEEACYVMTKLKGKSIRAQVDSGASISLVWSQLVPKLAQQAPIKTISGITGILTLPVVQVTVDLFGKRTTIDAVVYDKAPVDLIIGRNCPDFKDLLVKAEELDKIFIVTIRQQEQAEYQEEDSC